MYAGRSLHKAHVLTRLLIDTACRRLLDASPRARSSMLAQDLPTSARVVGLHQRQANLHFGRAAYCTSSHLTGRSFKGPTSSRLSAGCSRWSTAAQTRHSQRPHVRASATVVDEPTAGSKSQQSLPKFARRTSVRDIKVNTSLPGRLVAFC